MSFRSKRYLVKALNRGNTPKAINVNRTILKALKFNLKAAELLGDKEEAEELRKIINHGNRSNI